MLNSDIIPLINMAYLILLAIQLQDLGNIHLMVRQKIYSGLSPIICTWENQPHRLLINLPEGFNLGQVSTQRLPDDVRLV